MQIGYPTDVKHVAHIGMDGPSANTPSWVGCFFYLPSLLFLTAVSGPAVTSGHRTSRAKNMYDLSYCKKRD